MLFKFIKVKEYQKIFSSILPMIQSLGSCIITYPLCICKLSLHTTSNAKSNGANKKLRNKVQNIGRR